MYRYIQFLKGEVLSHVFLKQKQYMNLILHVGTDWILLCCALLVQVGGETEGQTDLI